MLEFRENNFELSPSQQKVRRDFPSQLAAGAVELLAPAVNRRPSYRREPRRAPCMHKKA